MKEADKNLGLVLMSQTKYLQLLEPELNEDNFSLVSEFPLNTILGNLKKLLIVSPFDRRERETVLRTAASRTDPSPFYILPKIHKPVVAARPITANHSYVLSELSQRLSRLLNREIGNKPVITVNSKQFVSQVERLRLPPNIIFFTYDVERLYPSINLGDAMSTLKTEFPEIFLTHKAFWLRVLGAIMYNNYVRVGDRIYRQAKGTATGTAVAPAFANLYLWAKFRPVFRRFVSEVIFQRRYIDDGFGIARSEAGARALLAALNNCSNLELTSTVSPTHAIYLDTEVYKGRRWAEHMQLDISIYTKPISKFLYLHARSNHPEHVLTGVVKGEMIRFLRNTSDVFRWKDKVKFLMHKLAQRGYSAKTLREAALSIRFKDRSRYLQTADVRTYDPGDFIVLPFHPSAKPLWRAIAKWYTAANWMKWRTRTLPSNIVFSRTPTIRSKAILNRSWSKRQVQSDLSVPAKRRRLND